MNLRCFIRYASLIVLLSIPGLSNAGASSMGEFVLNDRSMQGRSVFPWGEIDTLLFLDADTDGELSGAEFEAARGLLEDFGEMLYSLEVGGESAAMPATTVDLADDGRLIFNLSFTLPRQAHRRELAFEFAAAPDFPLHHRHAFRIVDASGNALIDEISDLSDRRAPFPSMEHVASAPIEHQEKVRVNVSQDSIQSGSERFPWLWIALAIVAGWLANAVMHKLIARED